MEYANVDEGRRLVVGLLREARQASTAGEHERAGVTAAAALLVCVGVPGLAALGSAAERLLADSARKVAEEEQRRQDATVYRVSGLCGGRRVVLDVAGRWVFEDAGAVRAAEFETWDATAAEMERQRAAVRQVRRIVAAAASRREWAVWDESDARAEWYGRQIGG